MEVLKCQSTEYDFDPTASEKVMKGFRSEGKQTESDHQMMNTIGWAR